MMSTLVHREKVLNSILTQADLIAATQALASSDNISVEFKSDAEWHAFPENNKIIVPNLPMHGNDLILLRGALDFAAMSLRYHDSQIHDSLRPVSHAEVFDDLERVRISIAGSGLPGVRSNLRALKNHLLQSADLEAMLVMEVLPVGEIAFAHLFKRTFGEAAAGPLDRLFEQWHSKIENRVVDILDSMADQIFDQANFARLALNLIRACESPLKEINPQTLSLLEPGTTNGEQDVLHRNLRARRKSPALVSLRSRTTEGPSSNPLPPVAFCTDASASCLRDLSTTNDYWIYTREFDEVVAAQRLTVPATLVNLRKRLDDHVLKHQRLVVQLKRRMRRLLSCWQMHHWSYFEESGVLDSKRLSCVILDPTASLVYKRLQDNKDSDTVVSLLIDNSGSMRGRSITVAAICADLLSRIFEGCGAKVEVLGFTTKDFKGGASYLCWLKNGKPPKPGRLSDLRHIIYKSADDSWNRSHRNLGLMLQEDVLKENIDGEALLWAYRRLVDRSESRRILMVVSDGAPVDDSTMSNNSSEFLSHHLRKVVRALENDVSVELCAINIGYQNQYYRHAICIDEIDRLGEAMAEQLAFLIDGRPNRQLTRCYGLNGSS